MYYMQLKGLGPAAWDEIVKALEFLEDIFNDCVGLLTTSPEDFHNGDIWAIIKEIYGVLENFVKQVKSSHLSEKNDAICSFRITGSELLLPVIYYCLFRIS